MLIRYLFICFINVLFHAHGYKLPFYATRPAAATSIVATAVDTTAASSFSPACLSRRDCFFKSAPCIAAVSAATTSVLLMRPEASLAISAEASREQWAAAVLKLRELDESYDTVAGKGGGDAVRERLGTAGDNAASPLYQIDKALNKLLTEAEDPAEFGERLDDFIYRLRQADSMAYSANFAGGSGKPKPPAVYLQLAHDEVIAMRELASRLNAAL